MSEMDAAALRSDQPEQTDCQRIVLDAGTPLRAAILPIWLLLCVYDASVEQIYLLEARQISLSHANSQTISKLRETARTQVRHFQCIPLPLMRAWGEMQCPPERGSNSRSRWACSRNGSWHSFAAMNISMVEVHSLRATLRYRHTA